MSTFDENHNYKDFFTRNNGETIPLLSYGVVAFTTFFLAYTTLLKNKKKTKKDEDDDIDEENEEDDDVINMDNENDNNAEFSQDNEVRNDYNNPFNRPELKPDIIDNREQDNMRGGKYNKYNSHLSNILDIIEITKELKKNKNTPKKTIKLIDNIMKIEDEENRVNNEFRLIFFKKITSFKTFLTQYESLSIRTYKELTLLCSLLLIIISYVFFIVIHYKEAFNLTDEDEINTIRNSILYKIEDIELNYIDTPHYLSELKEDIFLLTSIRPSLNENVQVIVDFLILEVGYMLQNNNRRGKSKKNAPLKLKNRKTRKTML